jgi:hypothetical protein
MFAFQMNQYFWSSKGREQIRAYMKRANIVNYCGGIALIGSGKFIGSEVWEKCKPGFQHHLDEMRENYELACVAMMKDLNGTIAEH